MMRRVATAAVACLLMAGCVPASPDAGTYDDKVNLTVSSAISEARTVQELLQTLHADRMLRPAAKAQLRYSEDALDTASGALSELNPPSARDRLDQRVGTLLEKGSSLLRDARIAVERDDRDRYPGLARDLDALISRLETIEGRTA